MPIVTVAGVIGNVAAIFNFGKSKQTQKNFYTFMFYLAIFDLMYLVVAILLFILPHLTSSYVNNGTMYYIAPWAIPFGQISMTGSIYFTAAVTIERYLTVCHPFYMVKRKLSALPISVGITIFAISYNLPKFFEMSTEHSLCYYNQTFIQDVQMIAITSKKCEMSFYTEKHWHYNDYEYSHDPAPNVEIDNKNSFMVLHRYDIKESNLRFNIFYVQAYLIYSNLFVNGVIPFTVVIILNILIVLNLQDADFMPSPERLNLRKYFLLIYHLFCND